jgi:hypothetical protein
VRVQVAGEALDSLWTLRIEHLRSTGTKSRTIGGSISTVVGSAGSEAQNCGLSR